MLLPTVAYVKQYRNSLFNPPPPPSSSPSGRRLACKMALVKERLESHSVWPTRLLLLVHSFCCVFLGWIAATVTKHNSSRFGRQFPSAVAKLCCCFPLTMFVVCRVGWHACKYSQCYRLHAYFSIQVSQCDLANANRLPSQLRCPVRWMARRPPHAAAPPLWRPHRCQ